MARLIDLQVCLFNKCHKVCQAAETCFQCIFLKTVVTSLKFIVHTCIPFSGGNERH